MNAKAPEQQIRNTKSETIKRLKEEVTSASLRVELMVPILCCHYCNRLRVRGLRANCERADQRSGFQSTRAALLEILDISMQ